MSIQTFNFYGDSSIGLYGFATEKFVLLGHLEHGIADNINHTLGVKPIITTVAGTNLAGVFCAGNSNGVVLPEIAYPHEISQIEKHAKVLVLEGKYTALGNIVLVNDNGCVISEKLKGHKEELEDFFKVPVEVSKVAGLDLPGALGIANSNGCVVHKGIKDKEKEVLESTLKVKAEPADVNFGSSFVKSGIIANSKGLLVGKQTSGPELEKIAEILGFS
ncbi:MAG TPA: translation initiation factor IF-6 [archaeon]|nr:translation initiation factor IF-6 [archaeon]